MKLIWKILRAHLSIGQLVSFFVANAVGLCIIMLSIQIYADIAPVLSSTTDFLKPEYVVISKPVTSIDTFTGKKPTFSRSEQRDLSGQPFVDQMGLFRAAQYGVYGSIEMGDYDISSEMFFESVPDRFVDVKTDQWQFSPDDDIVPIVIPRDYLALYNFGFAQGNAMMPAVSEKLLTTISIDITLYGNRRRISLTGQVVGLSNRLNTILVPESFIQWSNAELATDTLDWEPSRIILQVNNPADARVASYMHEKGYVVANDRLDASKASWFLHILVTIVMMVGISICVLACYILVLSIFLLLQKNTRQLHDLRLIGYPHHMLSRPYIALVAVLNAFAWLAAAGITWGARVLYLPYLRAMVEDFSPASCTLQWLISGGFMLVIILINVLIIARRMRRI